MTRRFPQKFWASRSDTAEGIPLDDLKLPAVAESAQARWCEPQSVPPADVSWATSTAAKWLHHPGSRRAVYVPEDYEANYAYPLIVWLHGTGGSERDLLSVMPKISTKNYFGVAFRGTLPSNDVLRGGFRWAQSRQIFEDFKHELHETVCQLRREYHIHSERIYPVGFDDGATLALQLLLDRPEWFGGAIALGGRFPNMKHPLVRYRQLHGKRFLMGTGSRDWVCSVAEMIRASRLLHAAGMHVSTRSDHAAHEVTPNMLRHVNHWLMEGIASATCR